MHFLFLFILSWAARVQPNPPAEPFHFALVSDTHIGNPTASEDLQRVVDDINAHPELELVIISGDITEFGSDEELKEAKRLLDQLRAPWYVIPGNHDTKWSESGNNSFRQIFGYERFCFDFKGYRFAGCSSGPNMRMAPGQVPAEDLVWLDSVVQSGPKKRPILFFNHYPLDPGLANWDKVIGILKKGNIQAAFCGHGHANKAFSAEGIPSAMGRSSLRARREIGGYNWVTIAGDSVSLAERTPGRKTAAPWTSFALKRYDPRQDRGSYPRPDYSFNENYYMAYTEWSVQDPCDVGAGVAVDADRVYYANTCGGIKALDLESGRPLWAFQARGKIYSTPEVANGRVVAASADSTIYCLEAGSGRLAWKLKTAKAIVASPKISGDTVFIGSSEGVFRALALKDGKVLWENRQIEGFVETSPAVDAERVYFGTWGTYFYALNRRDGSIAWRWSNGSSNRMYSPAAVVPLLANGRVFIVAPDRIATALDAATGQVIWRSPGNFGRESLGISPDGSTLYVKAMQDTVSALSTHGPLEVRWRTHTGYGYDIAPSPMQEKEGILYIPTDKGLIYALRLSDRQIFWVHKVSNALVNNVVPLPGGDVLGSTMDGVVFRINKLGVSR